MAKLSLPRLHSEQEFQLGVPEASAVAPLEDGRFLIADDELGLHLCTRDGDALPISPRIRGDLEGVCIAPDGKTAWVLCEKRGTVWQAELGLDELKQVRTLGSLPRLGKRNRGWEGICFATHHWCDGPALLACHQRSPQLLGLFSLPNLAEIARYELPKSKRLRKTLSDLNDLAIHPVSGHVFVLSGRRGTVAELALNEGALQLVKLWRIDTSKRAVPEGLGFDQRGRLWLVTDGQGRLRQLRVPTIG